MTSIHFKFIMNDEHVLSQMIPLSKRAVTSMTLERTLLLVHGVAVLFESRQILERSVALRVVTLVRSATKVHFVDVPVAVLLEEEG